jgi:hypothetical protein
MILEIVVGATVGILILVLAGIGIMFLTMHALADYKRNKDVADSVLNKYLIDMKFKLPDPAKPAPTNTPVNPNQPR